MSARYPPGETIVPHAKGAGMLREVRSTLLASSRRALAEHGLKERYESHLAPEARLTLVEATMVAQWLPVELAVAHYQACDDLQLPRETLLELGDVVGAKIRGTLIGTFVGLAKTGGVTPWTPLARLDRVWGRMYRGGSIAVLKRGPKDAEVEMIDNPCANIDYWQIALSGLMRGFAEAFSRRAYVEVLPPRRPNSSRYRVSWA